VVCPSLPGYGFSGKPTLRVERRQVRQGLGDADGPPRYDRYGAKAGLGSA